ncbi:MAG: flagellar basal body rod protein FlgB [Planctomycetaceae bacterium]|jgi:flagellar basal-body rod protein FlgB
MALLKNELSLLSRLLDASEMRQKVIGQNIANVNTPGYRRLNVDFEAALAQEFARNGPTSPLQQAKPQINHTAGLTPRADGNNVDIDMEIGQMNKNALLQQVYLQVMGTEMGMMRKAIDGR